jgi:hypothetical protein
MSNEDPALPEESGEPEEPVDLDLDAEDVLLREAIGQPMTVRLGGEVITVPRMDYWPAEASGFALRGDFGTWAALVLTPEDFKVYAAVKLRNYQVAAIFNRVRQTGGVTPGKSPSSKPSSRRKPPR